MPLAAQASALPATPGYNESMNIHTSARRFRAERLAGGILFLLVLALLACKSAPPEDASPLDQAGVFSGVEPLRKLDLSADEVRQLVLARQAGITDEDCVELIQLARRAASLSTTARPSPG